MSSSNTFIQRKSKRLEKRKGALGTKVKGCSVFEGVALHIAQARQPGSHTKEAEASKSTSFFNAS
jgi:hypothetical protein